MWQAQNDFLLCSVHKDVAKYMLEAASGTENDQGMIKGVFYFYFKTNQRRPACDWCRPRSSWLVHAGLFQVFV